MSSGEYIRFSISYEKSFVFYVSFCGDWTTSKHKPGCSDFGQNATIGDAAETRTVGLCRENHFNSRMLS